MGRNRTDEYEKTFCSPKFCPKALRFECSRWSGNLWPPHSYEIKTIEIKITDFSQHEDGRSKVETECVWFLPADRKRNISDKEKPNDHP